MAGNSKGNVGPIPPGNRSGGNSKGGGPGKGPGGGGNAAGAKGGQQMRRSQNKAGGK